VKNKPELLEHKNDTDLDLNSQNLLMKTEIIQKDTEIDNLTKKVIDLNLINKERIKLINNLKDQLHDMESKIADKKRKYYFLVAKHKHELKSRDKRESDLYLYIILLKNRIQDLESMLDISTRFYKEN
ncbi:19818_t:CDS:2, partial [Gigaspora margarita]